MAERDAHRFARVIRQIRRAVHPSVARKRFGVDYVGEVRRVGRAGRAYQHGILLRGPIGILRGGIPAKVSFDRVGGDIDVRRNQVVVRRERPFQIVAVRRARHDTHTLVGIHQAGGQAFVGEPVPVEAVAVRVNQRPVRRILFKVFSEDHVGLSGRRCGLLGRRRRLLANLRKHLDLIQLDFKHIRYAVVAERDAHRFARVIRQIRRAVHPSVARKRFGVDYVGEVRRVGRAGRAYQHGILLRGPIGILRGGIPAKVSFDRVGGDIDVRRNQVVVRRERPFQIVAVRRARHDTHTLVGIHQAGGQAFVGEPVPVEAVAVRVNQRPVRRILFKVFSEDHVGLSGRRRGIRRFAFNRDGYKVIGTRADYGRTNGKDIVLACL